MQALSLNANQQSTLSPRVTAFLFFCAAAVLLFVVPFAADAVTAGTATIFDSLKNTTDSAIKPLIGVLIALSVAGGIIFSLMKGSWLFAGLGVAVAGLAYGADLVAGAAGFGALI